MQFRKIIAAGILGLLIAILQESLLALYPTCLGCMLMCAFRMFSLSVSGRNNGKNDSGSSRLERPATPSQLFAASLQLRRGELNKPVNSA